MSFAPIQAIKGNHVVHGTDAGLYVEFYMEAVKDEEATLKEGRPIFRDVEYIQIIPAGDKNTVVVRPVKLTDDGNTPPDNVRWPGQYAAFKNQQKQVTEGTPIEQWPILTKAQAMSFKAMNVHTVEMLAAVSDSNLQNLGMGARELRQKAIAYIEHAKSSAVAAKWEDEKEFLLNQIEALKNQMNAMPEEAKAKRGRPPKTED